MYLAAAFGHVCDMPASCLPSVAALHKSQPFTRKPCVTPWHDGIYTFDRSPPVIPPGEGEGLEKPGWRSEKRGADMFSLVAHLDAGFLTRLRGRMKAAPLFSDVESSRAGAFMALTDVVSEGHRSASLLCLCVDTQWPSNVLRSLSPLGPSFSPLFLLLDGGAGGSEEQDFWE